jgi:hypothetical protein
LTEHERDPLAGAGDEDATDEIDDGDELDEEDELEEEEAYEAEEAEEAPAAPAGRRGRGRVPVRAAPAAPTVSELAVHVSDRVSAVFVIGVVAVFAGILLYGMLLGNGGFITGLTATPPLPTLAPTASPIPSASSAASASPAASASSGASASPAASSSASSPASAAPSAASPSPSAG